MKNPIIAFLIGLTLIVSTGASLQRTSPAFYQAELIFPLESWHNHASTIVECPNGDLLVCWFHGSGERTADDVKIEGARLRRGSKTWNRFTMADTPNYPDTNPTMFIDPQQRLWLMWPTILANEWHTALMKYRISSDYQKPEGPPRWEVNEVLHVTPGPEFETTVTQAVTAYEAANKNASPERQKAIRDYIERTKKNAADKFFRRLGWMTRAHAFVVDGKRLIVPLYSDGFSFSLMAITDDWGKNWTTSTPLVGAGNIQPSIVRKKDGTLLALMRDNGPPPKRLHMSESRDTGKTWSPVVDSSIPNPGSGAEVISLYNGHWALIYNDTELGRNSLAVAISTDEGQTWKWKRHLEFEPTGPEAGAFHYPSIIQARDGSLDASYSYHLNKKDVPLDAEGKPARKSIKHANFNEEWVMQGDMK
jgi:predicted neuraminidase